MEQDRQQNEELSPTVAEIIRLLGSGRKPDQIAARKALGQITAGDMRQLLMTFEREARRRQKNRRLWGVVFGIVFLSYYFYLFGSAHKTPRVIVGVLWAIVTLVGFYLHEAGFTFRLHRNAVTALAQLEDVRLVGPLSDALTFSDRRLLIAALTRLLPRLKATDAGLLNERQRNQLYGALKTADVESVDFKIAILKALEQIGDSKSIPHIQKLAVGEGEAAQGTRIREAAEQCLPSLLQRIAREQANQTLLRASDPIAAPDNLLRPADGGQDDTPEFLLRVATPESPEAEPSAPQ